MFHIKICGVTTARDGHFVTLAGADGIGLNFVPTSERFVSLALAETIVKALAPRIQRVGVFVNSSVEQVIEYAHRLDLHWVQLHGEEPPEFIASLPGRSVLRAFRFDGDPQPITDYLTACRQQNALPAAIMIDAPRAGAGGGHSQPVDWRRLAEVRPMWGDLPLVLAGALTPFNVAEAIAMVRPAAVDVARGVESRPGHKDLLLVRAFVTAAKKAFSEAGTPVP